LNKYLIPAISALAAVFFILGIVYISNLKRKTKVLQSKDELYKSLLKALEPTKDLDSNFMNLLVVIASVIEAPSYALYLMDDKSGSYVLKSIRHMTREDAQIMPSYSGLLPYKKETFLMPSSLPARGITDSASLRKEGEVPLVFVPIRGKKAVILVGPASKVSKETLKKLDFIGKRSEKIFLSLLESEELKKKLKSTVSSERAMRSVSNVFSDFSGMLSMILSISMKTVNASAGLFISEEEGELTVEAAEGFDKQTEELIVKDKKTLSLIRGFVQAEKLVSLNKKDKRFFQIPPYFIASEVELIMLLSIETENGRGVAVFGYKDTPKLKDYQITALEIMSKRIGDIINNHKKFRELSTSYVDILKMLARMVDNLKPSTVGYSELMYRYAFVVCKELKLSPKETRDITLAAYLSNIGIIGLSDNILFKSGKYTELEYETMKMHAEAGASIIEATLGNHSVASIIRHHHERVDGYGYPQGLNGEEIPVGARILAVVQTFLAKIVGREYREALTFDKALAQLKTASGTQLDERIVDALVSWFERKQQENRRRNTSLGRCFEMRCVPNNICVNCPAYKTTDKNCWEVPGNLCAAHGNKCETCFVRTEYMNRIGRK
jgi:HD-GYP domain-containing protein (c-di-GMP phosphodiesterase class II)